MMGIYQITINKKKYIGSSCDLEQRKKSHFNSLNNNKHHNKYLQNLYNKYKEFNFEIIKTCEEEMLVDYEQFYISTYKPEINICKKVKPIRRKTRNIFVTLIKTNTYLFFNSVREAHHNLNISKTSIYRSLNNCVVVCGEYKFRNI